MHWRECLRAALVCGVVAGWPGTTASAAEYRAWITLETRGHTLLVRPYCQASSDATVHYRLTAIKSGPSGTSRSAQSGAVTLKAGEPQDLARLSLGVSRQDRYTLELEILRDGQRVAIDRVRYGGVI